MAALVCAAPVASQPAIVDPVCVAEYENYYEGFNWTGTILGSDGHLYDFAFTSMDEAAAAAAAMGLDTMLQTYQTLILLGVDRGAAVDAAEIGARADTIAAAGAVEALEATDATAPAVWSLSCFEPVPGSTPDVTLVRLERRGGRVLDNQAPEAAALREWLAGIDPVFDIVAAANAP